MRSRISSNGISALIGLQCSQDSISGSASRRVAALTSTTFCCSGAGSKKSRGMARILLSRASHLVHTETVCLYLQNLADGLNAVKAIFLKQDQATEGCFLPLLG